MKNQKEQNLPDNLSIKALLPWIMLALLFIILPYLTTWMMTPPGYRFLGTLVNLDDTSVYLSAMRQGAEGYWLFHYTFSPEALPPAFSHFPYMLIGRIMAALNISMTAGFHLFRIGGSLFTLFVIYYWVRTIFSAERRIQLTAWLLTVFGSGLGWLVVILFGAPYKSTPDLGFAEWSVILSMLGTAHFAIAFGLQTLFFLFIWQMTQKDSGHLQAVLVGVVAVLLGLFYSFNLVVISLTLGVYVLLKSWQAHGILWNDWFNAIIVALFELPLVFYYAVWIPKDPVWKAVQVTNNIVLPPSPLFVLLGLGLLAPLAALGAYQWLKQKRNSLPVVWGVVNLLAIYLPFPYSARFMMGLAVPVGSLAGFGLETVLLPRLQNKNISTWLKKASATPHATLRRVILILTIPSTLLIVLTLSQVALIYSDYPLLYFSESEIQAAEWLAENTSADALILTGYAMGNYFPRVGNAKVFTGQPFLTVNLEEKSALLTQFWQKETTNAWRENLIKEWRITHVYYGFLEGKIANGNITPPGKIVYQTGDIIIYDVRELIDDR